MSKSKIKRRLELEKMMGVDSLIRRRHEPSQIGPEQSGSHQMEEELDVERELERIEQEVRSCTKCRLHETRTQGVFARGRADSDLMIIGEGPGADEDREGIPFVGRAGKLLDEMIESMGLERDEVYITNIVKSRPPKNRDPRTDEIEACWPYLERQIELVDPTVIVTLGKPASNTLLGRNSAMGDMRGRWFSYEGVPVLPTYHPAYLLRQPSQKGKVWEDIKQVLLALHGEIHPGHPEM
jgi:DNA polymerase